MKNIIVMLLLFSVFAIQSADEDPNQWNAEEYAKHANPQFVNAAKNLYKVPLKGDEDIIEFGAGNGNLATHLIKNFIPKGTVHCVDASQQQIDYAKEMHRDNPQLSFECADVTSYETEKKYDGAISFMTLHWLKTHPAYGQALKKMSDALKPGGYALIGHLAQDGVLLAKDIMELLQEAPWNEYGKGFELPIPHRTVLTIVAAISLAGFDIEDLQVKKDTGHHKNKEEAIAHHTSVPFVTCIPKEKQHAFFTQVLERGLKNKRATQSTDGSITTYGTVIYMLLKKVTDTANTAQEK